jgi:hypothetical protein
MAERRRLPTKAVSPSEKQAFMYSVRATSVSARLPCGSVFKSQKRWKSWIARR